MSNLMIGWKLVLAKFKSTWGPGSLVWLRYEVHNPAHYCSTQVQTVKPCQPPAGSDLSSNWPKPEPNPGSS